MEHRSTACQRHDAGSQGWVGRSRLIRVGVTYQHADPATVEWRPRLGCDRRYDDDLTVFQFYGRCFSIAQFSLDQLARHWRFNLLLDQSLQRPRSISRIIATFTQIT